MDYGIVHSKAARTEVVKVDDINYGVQDRIVVKRYYENGKLKFEGEYNQMPKELRNKPNGSMLSGEGPFEFITQDYTKEGLSRWYHENGQLFKEMNYTDGKENGDLVIYHVNGKIMERGLIVMGERVGTWDFYTQEGRLYKKEHYNDSGSESELL